MKLIGSDNENKNKRVATIGFFDGVHLGHRYLIEELKLIAKQKNEESLVISFPIHPREVLQTDFKLQLLTTPQEKIQRLRETGLDACAILEFTKQLSKLSAFDFMKIGLKEQYNLSTLLIGHDHRFGRNREEGFEDYSKYGKMLGIELIQASRFSPDGKSKISSSEIRKNILEGKVQEANKKLGYRYSFQGTVVNGYKIGRKIGFPTANLEPTNSGKIIPPFGVYAVSANVEGENFLGMLNIGIRPTLKTGKKVSIEVHLFDFDKEIYGEEIQISIIEKIRDEKKFNTIDELIAQLNKDKKQTLRIINEL